MICTKCGQENPDEALACSRCGRKLQSVRRADRQAGEGDEAERASLPFLGARGGHPSPLGKYFEALIYALILAGGTAAGLWYGVYWPVYALAGVIGLVAWLRRI